MKRSLYFSSVGVPSQCLSELDDLLARGFWQLSPASNPSSPSFLGTQTLLVRRSAQNLWQNVLRMQGVFLVHRKRKMVASTVREFLLNEELLLEHVQQLAAELDRSKADTKTCLDLCSMLCTKFKGPLLNSFRTLCLCALQRSWPGLQESGICDFLHKDFTNFILDISRKRRKNGRNVTSFRAWPLWPATWVGYELGGSAPHQCR